MIKGKFFVWVGVSQWPASLAHVETDRPVVWEAPRQTTPHRTTRSPMAASQTVGASLTAAHEGVRFFVYGLGGFVSFWDASLEVNGELQKRRVPSSVPPAPVLLGVADGQVLNRPGFTGGSIC
jgi:hypothetical protein